MNDDVQAVGYVRWLSAGASSRTQGKIYPILMHHNLVGLPVDDGQPKLMSLEYWLALLRDLLIRKIVVLCDAEGK